MNSYIKGIIGIKLNGKLYLMTAERAEVMNYKAAKRLRHYKLSAKGYNIQYTLAKDF